jgi:hypothetical protein
MNRRMIKSPLGRIKPGLTARAYKRAIECARIRGREGHLKLSHLWPSITASTRPGIARNTGPTSSGTLDRLRRNPQTVARFSALREERTER